MDEAVALEMGQELSPLDLKKARAFDWLSRHHRGPAYISYSQFGHLPATSFEFGADGFGGACNYGGELLHLSAPSEERGLVYARGWFSDSLYSCLARAQMEYGGLSTFGLKMARNCEPYCPPPKSGEGAGRQRNTFSAIAGDPIGSPDGSSFRLGKMIERGCFNYRWPFNEYSLYLNESTNQGCDSDSDDEANTGQETGTCSMFSFIKDEVCYQVLRLEQGCQTAVRVCHPFPRPGQVVLSVSSPVTLYPLNDDEAFEEGEGSMDEPTVEDHSETHCVRLVDVKNRIALESRVYQLHIGAGRESYEELRLKPSPEYRRIRDASKHIPSHNRTDSNISNSSTLVGSVTEKRPLETKSGDNASMRRPSNPTFEYQAFGEIKSDSRGLNAGAMKAIFVASIRLVEWSSEDEERDRKYPKEWLDPPHLPSSEDIFRYVGVRAGSLHGVGAMWNTIFLGRDLQTDSVSEFTEISLIGRCLEKILQHDVVPGGMADDRALALVTNIFTYPSVNLRSMFWKVRFLVKLYDFLSRLRVERRDSSSLRARQAVRPRYMADDDAEVDPLDSRRRPLSEGLSPGGRKVEAPVNLTKFRDHDRELMRKIADSQCRRIQTALENIILFLVGLLSGPSLPSLSALLPCSRVLETDESDYYYIMITIWYVIREFPEAKWEFLHDLNGFTEGLIRDSCIPPDNRNFGTANKEKIPLLQWYHYGSMLWLAEKGFLPECWKGVNMEQRVYRLGNSARIALTGRLFSKSPYSVEDETIDRLALLARELSLEKLDTTASTVASVTMHRIKQRESTRYLNPGLLPLYQNGFTSAPWEIHALCHNSRLNVLALEQDDTSGCEAMCDSLQDENDPSTLRANQQRAKEVGLYKSTLYRFLNSEATLFACWERSHEKARIGWLRSEATAVLGSTLLDIHSRIPVGDDTVSRPSSAQSSPGASPFKLGTSMGQQAILAETTRAIEEVIRMQSRMAEQTDMVDDRASEGPNTVDWTAFAPPRNYHPENFIHSLDDTPHLYRPPATKTIVIPVGIQPYADPPGKGGFTWEDLDSAATAIPNSVSVSDIVAIRLGSQIDSAITAIKPSTLVSIVQHTFHKETHRSLASRRNVTIGPEKLVTALFDSVSYHDVLQQPLTLTRPSIVADLSDRSLLINWFNTESSIKQLTPSLVRMLAYVIHPESAAGLSACVLQTPQFLCRTGSSWVAHVTLRSWLRVGRKSIPPPFEPVEAERIVPLKLGQLEDVLGINKGLPRLGEYQLSISTIILSTNAFGDFSKSTIISQSIDDVEVVKLVEDASRLWQEFTHQPQTGRCLVFLQMLGLMCLSLCTNYTTAVDDLAAVSDFKSIFRNEVDQVEDTTAVPLFKQAIWNLNSLHKLRHSLEASIESITEAKLALMEQINEGATNRSVSLQRMCQEYVGHFENCLARLLVVKDGLDRNIALSERYRDGLSALTALKDSRASLKQNHLSLEQNQISISQNSTIQRLTYLTIAYLPMGLMAAIFAIPDEQDVVFQKMGTTWFIGAILVMSVATYIFAVLITDFVEFFRIPSNNSPAEELTSRPEHWLHRRPPQKRNLWHMIGRLMAHDRVVSVWAKIRDRFSEDKLPLHESKEP